MSLFWIVGFSCCVNSIVTFELLASFKGEVTTILLTLHENRTIQNKLTTRSVPDPPVRAGDDHPVLQGGSGPETTPPPEKKKEVRLKSVAKFKKTSQSCLLVT